MFTVTKNRIEMMFENKHLVCVYKSDENNKFQLFYNYFPVGFYTATHLIDNLHQVQQDKNVCTQTSKPFYEETTLNEEFTIEIRNSKISIKKANNPATITKTTPDGKVFVYENVTPDKLVEILVEIKNEPEINFINLNDPKQVYTVVVTDLNGCVLRTEGPSTLEESVDSITQRLLVTDKNEIDKIAFKLASQQVFRYEEYEQTYKIVPHYPLPD